MNTYRFYIVFSAIAVLFCTVSVYAQDIIPDADLPPLEDIEDLLAEEDDNQALENSVVSVEGEDEADDDSRPLTASELGLPELGGPDLDALTENPNSGIDRELGPDDFVVPDFLDDQNVLGLGQGANLERTRRELEEEARNRAFDAAIQSLLPLRPEEIRTLLKIRPYARIGRASRLSCPNAENGG